MEHLHQLITMLWRINHLAFSAKNKIYISNVWDVSTRMLVPSASGGVSRPACAASCRCVSLVLWAGWCEPEGQVWIQNTVILQRCRPEPEKMLGGPLDLDFSGLPFRPAFCSFKGWRLRLHPKPKWIQAHSVSLRWIQWDVSPCAMHWFLLLSWLILENSLWWRIACDAMFEKSNNLSEIPELVREGLCYLRSAWSWPWSWPTMRPQIT